MTVETSRLRGPIGPRRVATAGVAACALSLLLFAALQYRMPDAFRAPWGENAAGAAHFRRAVAGGSLGTLGVPAFRAWSATLLVAAWCGYALVLLGTSAGGPSRSRRCLPVISALAIALAVGCPASLSYDSYAYVAYGRMPLLYGLNPCVTTPRDLVPLADATAPVVGTCGMPCVYGPVWIALAVAEVALLAGAGLFWQVVGMKLLAGASLVLAAAAGGDVAERGSPGRGDLARWAIGLNPLLLVEGPGNGHNDLVMMGLLLAAAALWGRGRALAGDLAFGLSVGIKFLPIAALPWILLDRCRGLGPRQAARVALVSLTLALAPTALAYVPLWRGAETFTAQALRTRWVGPEEAAGREDLARQIGAWGIPARAGRAAALALDQWAVIDLYAALSLWLWWGRSPGRWLDAWVVLTLGLLGWSVAVRFPWYLTWPLVASLASRGRRANVLGTLCNIAAFACLLGYLRPPR